MGVDLVGLDLDGNSHGKCQGLPGTHNVIKKMPYK